MLQIIAPPSHSKRRSGSVHRSVLLTGAPSRCSLEAETCTAPHKCGWSEPRVFSASSKEKWCVERERKDGGLVFLHQEKWLNDKEETLTQTLRLTLSSESAFSLSGGVSTGDTTG